MIAMATPPQAPSAAPPISTPVDVLLRETRFFYLCFDLGHDRRYLDGAETMLRALRAIPERTPEEERALVKAEIALGKRARRPAPIPCTVCGGEGVLPIPVCHHGFECGSGCGGAICGDIDEPCEHCAGSGKEPCVDCGEPAHLIHKGAMTCVRCMESEVG